LIEIYNILRKRISIKFALYQWLEAKGLGN